MSVVRQMSYAPPEPSVGGVEVLSFERLRGLNDGGTQRADFHVVGVVSGGSGAVSVDFERHGIAARSVIWIPPGAVHRWDDIGELDGQLVLFVPTAPVGTGSRSAAAAWPPASWSLPEDQWAYVSAAVQHLELETRAVTPGVPELLVSALLLRVALPPAAAGASTRAAGATRSDLFAAFRDLVEADYRRFHDAAHYATTLGYASRTLTRAVQAATGLTAKRYLTERIVLEAKRLLAHDRHTASRCATELGFADASRFSAFFRGATGEAPGRWQQRQLHSPDHPGRRDA